MIFAFVRNIVFNSWGAEGGRESAVQSAVSEGAVVSAGIVESTTR